MKLPPKMVKNALKYCRWPKKIILYKKRALAQVHKHALTHTERVSEWGEKDEINESLTPITIKCTLHCKSESLTNNFYTKWHEKHTHSPRYRSTHIHEKSHCKLRKNTVSQMQMGVSKQKLSSQINRKHVSILFNSWRFFSLSHDCV